MSQNENMWKMKIPKLKTLRQKDSKLLPFSCIVYYLISDFILQ